VSRDEFAGWLGEQLGFEARDLLSNQLFSELGFDSLHYLELVVLLEDHGVDLDEAAISGLRTLEDAFVFYSTVSR
jgi:acyl carrier protein